MLHVSVHMYTVYIYNDHENCMKNATPFYGIGESTGANEEVSP